MKTSRLHLKSLMALPLGVSLWLCAPLSAQTAHDPAPLRDQDNDATRKELVDFNRFMESHPEIAEQLRKDPSLVDNREFVANHPGLQTYLEEHPSVRAAIKQNPDAFMRQEQRYDMHDGDISHRDVSEFDRFLDSHPEIAEQLRKDPSLVDQRQFVENHPALQTYLREHPGVRDEIKANPNAFMRQEDRYEDRHDRDMHGETASFGDFLNGHSTIAQQLSKDPSLVKNQEYMANHPDLQAYLNAHPAAQAQLTENPESFIRSSQQFANGGQLRNPTSDAKPKQ